MTIYGSFSDEVSKEIDRIRGCMKECRRQIKAEGQKEEPDFGLIHNIHLDIARHHGTLEGLNIAGGILYREVMKPSEADQ